MTPIVPQPMATKPAKPNYGAVFTHRWVVELILGLCGYEPTKDLTRLRVVEPAVGKGAFLEVLVERLIEARENHVSESSWDALKHCISAWDLQESHVEKCRADTVGFLINKGCPEAEAELLAQSWIRVGDFLLTEHDINSADLVVGNPPYIRIEYLDPALLARYRHVCPTMGGRADVYVGFFEHGLKQLKPDGKLGFICADRWMRNQYGKRLREMIVSGGFSVDVSLIMHDAPAFVDTVSAYPAITVFRRGEQGSAVLGSASESFEEYEARNFLNWALDPSRPSLKTAAASGARVPY